MAKGFFSTLSYLPTIGSNYLRETLHSFFPAEVEEVCVHPSDFICHGTNGVAKLADNLPAWFMAATDTIYDNPYKTIGTLALGTTLTGLYFCYGRRQHSEQETAANDNTAVHEQQQQDQQPPALTPKPHRKPTHHHASATSEENSDKKEKKVKKEKKKKRPSLTGSGAGNDD